MSASFQRKVAVVLLAIYVPVILTLELQHHDGSLYPPQDLFTTVAQAGPHNVAANSLDGFCMACHFASHHFFEQPFHLFSTVHDAVFQCPFTRFNFRQTPVHSIWKRGPPSISIS